MLGHVSEWWYHHGSFNLFFRITLINNKHMYPLVTGLVISWHNYYQNTTKHSRKSALTWCRRHGVHHTIVFPGFLIPWVMMNSVVTYTVSSTPSKSQKIQVAQLIGKKWRRVCTSLYNHYQVKTEYCKNLCISCTPNFQVWFWKKRPPKKHSCKKSRSLVPNVDNKLDEI